MATGQINQAPAQKRKFLDLSQVFSHFELASGTVAAVLTTAYIQDPLSDWRFKVTLLGGETLKVEGTTNGTNFKTITVVDESTGNRVTAALQAVLPSGSYKIPLREYGQFRQFKFTKSAAVQAVTLAVAVARPYRSRA